MSEALKPCPFCDGEAERINIEEGEAWGGSAIQCSQCAASSPLHFDRKENLVSSWNRRASPPESDALKLAESALEAIAKGREGSGDEPGWSIARGARAKIAALRGSIIP